jgi:hypothetical protein
MARATRELANCPVRDTVMIRRHDTIGSTSHLCGIHMYNGQCYLERQRALKSQILSRHTGRYTSRMDTHDRLPPRDFVDASVADAARHAAQHGPPGAHLSPRSARLPLRPPPRARQRELPPRSSRFASQLSQVALTPSLGERGRRALCWRVGAHKLSPSFWVSCP